jgi:hypothetical protein
MAIQQAESFTYIGYTLGGAKPTLYFKEGHYTQVHQVAENVGWHPNRHGKYTAVNVSRQFAESILLAKNFAERAKLLKPYVNSAPPEDNSNTAHLLEYWTRGGEIATLHVSRGKLIKVGGPGFNPAYDAKYAYDVLLKGRIARNDYEAMLK